MDKTEIKNKFEEIVDRWNLAVVPSFEEFADTMDDFKTLPTNEEEIEEIEAAADLFLSDFTEQKIKTKMLSEHQRIVVFWKDVKRFENNGGRIIIGGTAEEVIADERSNVECLSVSEKRDLLENYDGDIEKYLQAYSRACVDEVKYGVVIESEW